MNFKFTGRYYHALDPKGRLTLPSSFRTSLNHERQGMFALSLDNNKCLAIYPLPVWDNLLERLKSLSKTDAQAASFTRVLLSTVFDCEVDRQGRVLVPPQLRELAGIERDVAVVGHLETVEVWDRTRWEEYFRQGLEQLSANASKLTL